MEKYKILLGLDFGMKNIGVAVGQSITKSATPLNAIIARDGVPSLSVIERIIQEWNVELIVIGYPVNMDGSIQEITYSAKKLGKRLYNRFKIPINFVDERLSTYEAQKYRKFEKIAGHSMAAKIIIESWFEKNPL